jgi:hypothetical protein
VQPPLALDSSTDPAAPARTGPTRMTLAPTSSGQQMVTVSVDPTWLHNRARVFPVQVDVPIATGYSVANTGVFGTVNRCAPAVRAPLASVVVGVEGPCTYHGEIYFNVTSLLPDTPIQAATLRLYAPKQAGVTDVKVYPNAPVTDLAPPGPPSWSTAPAVAPGATGIAQSGSAGHWQRWDVTSLVRQWVRNAYTNGGVTLVGTGAPVLFASPLSGGNGEPATAPSLDITYGPRPTTASTGGTG